MRAVIGGYQFVLVYTVPRATKDEAVADVAAAVANGALPVGTTPDCRCTGSRSSEPPTRTPRWKAVQSAKS